MPLHELPEPEHVRLPNGKERILYRDRHGNFITEAEYLRQKHLITGSPLGSKDDTQRLRIQTPLPDLIPLDDFLFSIREKLRAIDVAYSTFALLYAGQFGIIEQLRNEIIEDRDDESLAVMLHQYLRDFGYEPPKLAYVHYGSDLITDVLGIGKVVEQIVSLIDKTKQWRIQTRDQESKDKLLDRELQLKDEEVRKAQIENVKEYLEVIKAARDLSISDERLYPLAEAASRAIEQLYPGPSSSAVSITVQNI